MKRLFKELLLLVIVSIPMIYLLVVWEKIPELVPSHFGFDGTPDDWSKKSDLPYLLTGLGYGFYLLMLLIPYFDPKKKIELMGEKYFSLRMIMVCLMASISIFIIYASVATEVNTRWLFVIIAVFFSMLGNYFQTLKPNYFIGIKTPWALENEDNWRKTHRLAGKLWVAGGLLILLISLVLNDMKVVGTFFITVILLISAVPIVYSYLLFKKTSRNQ